MTSTPEPLPFGSITDVEGVRVGHHQRVGRGWQTGTTVVFAPQGATPGVDVRGGGPGTRETDALEPHNLIEQIHAVCLTGGSAYGLAAADGVMAWLEEQSLGFTVGPPGSGPGHVVPVVPAAVIFDLGRGGDFGHRPDAGFGRRAIAAARRSEDRWGSVGAGAGAVAGGLQGGVGTASTTVRLPRPGDGPSDRSNTVEVVVGALAVVNANGSPIDRATGLPWELAGPGRRRPMAVERRGLLEVLDAARPPLLNTTIGVVATSARLTKAEVGKVASVAHDGLARAVRPAHSMVDGDTIFGLATGDIELASASSRLHAAATRNVELNLLLVAAAETFAAACTHAILSATSISDRPSYLDLCPTVRTQ